MSLMVNCPLCCKQDSVGPSSEIGARLMSVVNSFLCESLFGVGVEL